VPHWRYPDAVLNPRPVSGGRLTLARLAPILLSALVLLIASAAFTPAVAADSVLAQETETEQQDQGDTAEETGADEGQTEGAAEAGPPWTYQMARLGFVLLVVLALGIGLAYYRFVMRRARGEA
jgi:hypothetical protein